MLALFRSRGCSTANDVDLAPGRAHARSLRVRGSGRRQAKAATSCSARPSPCIFGSRRNNSERREVQALAEAIRAEIAKAVVGQETTVELMLVALFAGRPHPARGAAWHSQDPSSAQLRPGGRPRLRANPVHARPDARRHHRREPVQLPDVQLHADPRADLHRASAGGRDQPTPPKTQAALLEAMQERQVTIDGESHQLGDRFMVVATQNPIEQQGVYPLPEAQLDRFLFKQTVDYPSVEEEKKIIATHGAREDGDGASGLGRRAQGRSSPAHRRDHRRDGGPAG